MNPARDPVGADQAVRDISVHAPAERLVERVVIRTVIRVHGHVPIDHLGVGLRPTEEAISARALEQLLQRAVRQGERQIDVSTDDVEEACEAPARLGEPLGVLLAGGDVGDDAFDEHAAVRLRARTRAIAQRARDSVDPDEAIRDLGVVTAQQAAVERLVLRPVRGRDARLPERPVLDALGDGSADQALGGERRGVMDIAAVRRDLAGVDVLLEEVEDSGQPDLARSAAAAEPVPAQRLTQPPQTPRCGRARGGHLGIGGMGRRTIHGLPSTSARFWAGLRRSLPVRAS